MFVWVEAYRPSQHFFSHAGTFSSIEPVLSNEYEVSCSRTQHSAPVIGRTGTEVSVADYGPRGPWFET